MMDVFRRAHEHKGAAFVEIYQNCNVFNDGAFEAITGKDNARRHAHRPQARRADPVRCRGGARRGRSTSSASARSSTSPTSARTSCSCTTSTATDPTLAFALSRLADQPHDADARRRVPRRRAPDLRDRGAAAARRGGRSAPGPGDLRRAARLGADLGSQLRLGSRRQASRRGTPSRCAASGGRTWSSPACARPRTRRPGSARRSPAGAGSRRRWHRSRPGAATVTASSRYPSVASPSDGRHRRRRSAPRRRRAGPRAARASLGSTTSARGREQREPGRRRRARAHPRRAIARRALVHRVGRVGARVARPRTRRRGRRAGPSGRRARRRDDGSARTHSCGVGELDDQRHDRLRAPGRRAVGAARRGRCTRSRSGGGRRRARAGAAATSVARSRRPPSGSVIGASS